MTVENATYDLVLLLDPETEPERREKIVTDVESLISSHTELLGRHDWGMRPTTFDVRKRAEADYRLIQFHADAPLLEALHHALRITDNVLRFRIVKLRRGTPAAPETQPVGLVTSGDDDDDDRGGRGRGRDRD